MRIPAHLIALLLILPPAHGMATAAAGYSSYRPQHEVSGEIRLWGSPEDKMLLRALEAGFARHHPGARLAEHLHGPESTIAGVYTGVADVAFMAREVREPMERMAFEWARLSKPFVVDVANAGLVADRPSAQLAVFVNEANPIEQLSLAQLDAIFSAERKRGGRHVDSWGVAGLTGIWDDRPVRAYASSIESIAALFFRRRVMKDSRKWYPDLIDLGTDELSVAAVASDPAGITFAPLRMIRDGVRPVPLSAEGAAAYLPTPETVATGSYPLARTVAFVIYRPAGEAVAPRLKEFLRFVLSGEGQEIIARHGDHLPLGPGAARQQLRRLD